jgi:FkbM family methyltransferase
MRRRDAFAAKALRRLPRPALRLVARALARPLDVAPEPGWTFTRAVHAPGRAAAARRAIWTRFADERLEEPLVVPWLDGLRLRLFLGNDLSQAIFVGRSFEPNELALLDAILEPGMVVVDGGANEGVYSVFAAQRVRPNGTVLAFEPSPREHERLLANLRLNRLDNVVVRQAALDESVGTARVAVAAYGHEGQNTIGEVVANPLVQTARRIQVETTTLDEAVAEAGLARVDVIKLDVEGFEPAVLRGASATLERFAPILQLEVEEGALASHGFTKAELVRLLADARYETWTFDADTAQLVPNAEPGSLDGNVIAAPSGWRPPPLGAEPARAPYLSVVATARNDDHGRDLLYRMQLFVSTLATQAQRFRVRTELVLVEWNPPADRPAFAESLDWPEASDWFEARIVQVPPAIHAELAHSDRLPLFQMIAKNVGIARSRGRYVLATNVDVILSDELMRAVATRLAPGVVFRADRYDVRSVVVPGSPIEEILAGCASNVIRRCRLEGTDDLRTGEHFPIYGPLTELPGPLARWARLLRFGFPLALRLSTRGAALVGRGLLRRVKGAPHSGGLAAAATMRVRIAAALAVLRERRAAIDTKWELERARVRLHTNACGDFTLMSRDDWVRLRGYAELQRFSMHLDSLLLYEAHYAGLKHEVLPGPIYHLEHEGGFKPDADAVKALSDRLEERAIPQITNDEFLDYVLDMFRRSAPLSLNGETWGFADRRLPEVRPTRMRVSA